MGEMMKLNKTKLKELIEQVINEQTKKVPMYKVIMVPAGTEKEYEENGWSKSPQEATDKSSEGT
jgi:hypothetical protein